MKKIKLFFFLLALGGVASAQENKKTPTPMEEKLEAVFRDPKTAERAARADALLVHGPRWAAGSTNIPTQSSIVPKSPKREKRQ